MGQTRFPPARTARSTLSDDQVLGIVTGEGTARASASVTALGHDPRFDLSHAYWVVAAIAGIDPKIAFVGSAAWAHYVVDGDLAHEIDAREIPPDWPTGHTPLGRYLPYQLPCRRRVRTRALRVLQQETCMQSSGMTHWLDLPSAHAHNASVDLPIPACG
jgi:purine nucleoside permease